MVMAWSVDRLGRSLQDLVGFLSELHALKIDLFLRQQGLDTTTPAGKAMFQMMGVFAEFERAMIQERVRAGLARAKSEGKRLGRPPIASALEKRIREALATPGRPGMRVIAERFGVNPSTVRPCDPAQLVHCVAEDVVAPLRLGIVGTPAEPYENEGHPPTLLRVRRYRPSRRTTDNSQKFPPPHVRSWAQETASYRLKRVL